MLLYLLKLDLDWGVGGGGVTNSLTEAGSTCVNTEDNAGKRSLQRQALGKAGEIKARPFPHGVWCPLMFCLVCVWHCCNWIKAGTKKKHKDSGSVYL